MRRHLGVEVQLLQLRFADLDDFGLLFFGFELFHPRMHGTPLLQSAAAETTASAWGQLLSDAFIIRRFIAAASRKDGSIVAFPWHWPGRYRALARIVHLCGGRS